MGNSIFPILNANQGRRIFIYACDFSSIAVDVVRNNIKYDENLCRAFVWDVCGEITSEVSCGSLDIVLCIYVLSAIPPEMQQTAVKNLVRLAIFTLFLDFI